MMDRKTEPEIRFKGFTDSWEQRKLGDVVGNTFGGGTPATTNEEFWEGDIPWIQSSNAIEGELFDIDVKKHISRDGLTHSAAQLIPENSVAVVTHVGVGKLVFMPYSYATSQDFISLSDLKCNPKFLCYALYKKLKEDLHIVQGSAIKGITKEDLMSKQLFLPSVDEQRKIADTLLNLDNLITLHQRKCDKLCDFKKALLCNMFPAAEADAPKVRFKGYTKPWKHWTLGELYTERKEAGNDDLPILSVSIHSGVSADELDSAELGKAVRRSEDKSLYKHTYKGDLVFNMMRAWQGAIGVVPKEGMVSPAYITAIPNDEVFPEFMDYCLRREEVINQINNLSYGVTDFRKRLYWDSFVRVQIMLPSVEEQKKIAETLVQLDKLIELQSAKVEKLKNLKAACLEKMFV